MNNGEIYIGDPIDSGAWGTVTMPMPNVTTTGIGIDKSISIQPYTTDGSISIDLEDTVKKEEYEKEIKKRDDKIAELEGKLESLTKQVASILDGNKEIIDNNITTEKLKSLFED